MSKKRNLFKNLNQGVLKEDKKIIKTASIKQQITVLPELRDLIPPLKEEESAALEENILQHGCRDALLVWEREGDYVLIDGHNRYGICTRHQLDYNIKLLDFTDLEAAKAYMIDNQLGRRNLTPEQASYLRGLKYNREKLEKGKYDREGQKEQNNHYAEESREATSERLAKEFAVSEKTIKRDALFAAGLEQIGQLNPEMKQDILSGKIKVNKGDVQKLAKIRLQQKPETPEDLTRLANPQPEQKPEAAPPAQVNPAIAEAEARVARQLRQLQQAKSNKLEVYKQLKQAVEALGKLLEGGQG